MHIIPTYGTGTFTVHCPKKLLPAVSHWNDTASGSVDALASYRGTWYTQSVTQPFSCTLAIHKTPDSMSRYRLVTSWNVLVNLFNMSHQMMRKLTFKNTFIDTHIKIYFVINAINTHTLSFYIFIWRIILIVCVNFNSYIYIRIMQ